MKIVRARKHAAGITAKRGLNRMGLLCYIYRTPKHGCSTPHGALRPPLALDMDFGEAMQRFAKTDPAELPDRVMLKKKKRTNKPASKAKKAKP